VKLESESVRVTPGEPEKDFGGWRRGRQRRLQASEVSVSASRHFPERLATDGNDGDFSVAQARREFRANGWWTEKDSNCCSLVISTGVCVLETSTPIIICGARVICDPRLSILAARNSVEG
jgi:hypothetical protein